MSRSDPVAVVLTAYPVIHHALRQRAVAGPAGSVSSHQATVLAHLEGAAGQTLTELAGVVGVALPTMSLLIDRLVRAGLVDRARDPADGRRVALGLTAAGRTAAKERSLLDPGRVRLLLKGLTPAERTAGVQGLATLAAAVRRLGGALGSDGGGKGGS